MRDPGTYSLETEEQARYRGQAVAARLAPDWTVRTWENLGWHAAVRSPCERVEVHANYHGGRVTFTAFLNSPGGLPAGRWAEDGTSPSMAVRAVVLKAQEELLGIAEVVGGLRALVRTVL